MQPSIGPILLLLVATSGVAEAQRPVPRRVDVVFSSGGHRLRGTLHLPASEALLPAVVVLGGSDRGPRGSQKTGLAGALARGGVAALSYDSPGTGASGGDAMLQSRLERAAEALAAVHFLRSFDGVDPDRVGLVGGSEGARVALLAAGGDPDVACAVAISGSFGITMLDLARYRIEAMGLRHGLDRVDVEKALALEQLLFALTTGEDVVEWRLLRARSAGFADPGWGFLLEAVPRCRGPLPDDEREAFWVEFRAVLRRWSAEPWFAVAVVDRRSFERVLALEARQFFAWLERSPLARGDWFEGPAELATYARVACPVLGLWGEEDDFLPPRRSAAWLAANLVGTDAVTLEVLPGADHSLMAPGEPRVLVDGYPEMLVAWLGEHLGAGR